MRCISPTNEMKIFIAEEEKEILQVVRVEKKKTCNELYLNANTVFMGSPFIK